MRTLKNLFAIILLAVAATTFANTDPEMDSVTVTDAVIKQEIHKEITQMLKKSTHEYKDGLTATVLFTVNRKNQIVILEVKSDDTTLEGAIKGSLNYKTLKTMIPKDNLKAFTLKLSCKK